MARIENHKYSIEEAFRECFYVVPDYQREYVWTEKEVQQLLDDIDDQIVRFDTQAKTIIWALDGRAFQPGVWEVNGNFLRSGNPFQVRFGNVEGERRAYFTETIPATICDIEVPGEALLIFATDTPVPQ